MERKWNFPGSNGRNDDSPSKQHRTEDEEQEPHQREQREESERTADTEQQGTGADREDERQSVRDSEPEEGREGTGHTVRSRRPSKVLVASLDPTGGLRSSLRSTRVPLSA